MRKRISALILAAAMTLSLAACGGETGKGTSSASTNKNNEAAKQGVFEYDDIALDLGVSVQSFNITEIKKIDEFFYMIAGMHAENDYRNEYIVMDRDGKIQSHYAIYEEKKYDSTEEPAETEEQETEAVIEDTAYEEYSNIYNYTILSDGNLAYVDMKERMNVETGEYTSNVELVVRGVSGEEVFRTEIVLSEEEGGYTWVNGLIESKEGTIFAVSYDAVAEIDMTGKVLAVNKTNEVTKELYSPAFYKDGMPVYVVWNEDYTSSSYSVIDFRTGQVVEEVALPNFTQNFSVSDGTGSGYEFVLVGNNAVYGINVGDTEPTLIMDYVNSDLAAYRLNSVTFAAEDTFIALYSDIVEYDTHIAKFTKVAPEDVPDKNVLTLATYYKNTDLIKEVIDFNKENENLRITVKDYSEYATQEDYEAGITVLNNEIISGNVPDIIACSDRLSIANYANKGFLADFYELIEKDDTIKLEDYCENVFEAYAIDGKLYELPTKFYIWTVCGKTSIFGEETSSLTWDKLNSILEQYPDAAAFRDITKEDVLANALRYSYNQFVDEVTGDCSFDSDAFKHILEFANTFPKEIDYDALYADDDYWLMMQTQYVDNRTLLVENTMYSLYEGWYNAYGNFMEEATPVGFPTDDGMGSTVNAMSSFAISAKSVDVNGAWEFVKGFLMPEQQFAEKEYESDYVDNRYAYWGLPILKEALYDAGEVMKEEAYYLDEEGNKVVMHDSIWSNGEEIILDKPSDEQIQKWIDFVLSVNKKGSDDYAKALEIISEEAAAYFNGAKSVDDVAGIIQSRMNIFISEDK